MKRSRWVSPQEIVRIVVLIACLVGVIVLKAQCGRTLGGLFRVLDSTAPVDGGGRRSVDQRGSGVVDRTRHGR